MRNVKTKADRIAEIYNDVLMTAYVECALWSSSDNDDEPLDKNYTIEDFTVDSLFQIMEDCKAFLKVKGVMAAIEDCGNDYSQAGHDFWLTRNGHGTGFWDRGDEECYKFLTKVSNDFGEIYINVWRGKLYYQ